MKKRMLALLLATAMLAGLTACTGGATTSGTPQSGGAASQGATSGKTVIEVWTEDRHDATYVNEMVEKYNQTNPDNIEIKLTTVTENYFSMLSMAYSSGTAPDLAGVSAASIAPAEFKMYVESGLFKSLDSYIADAGAEFEKVTDISKHHFQGMNTFGDSVYWVPTAVRSGVRVIYNENLTKEAGMTEFPKTMADMAALSRKITTDGNGQYYGFATTSSSPFVRLLQGVAEMSGQNAYGYDYVNGVFDFSGFKEIVQQYGALLKDDSLFPGSPTQGVDAMRAQFADGKIGLWANASQEAGVFTEQFPVKDFEWKTALPPTIGGEIKGALSSTPQKGLLMMSGTKNADAAWKVIEFFSSEEFIKGYCEGGYALPYSSYISSVVDNSKAGRISDFALTPYENVYPTAPAVTVEGDNAAVVLVNAAMGLVDIDEAIKDLNTRYNQALERDLADGKVQRLTIKDYNPLKPNEGTFTYTDK